MTDLSSEIINQKTAAYDSLETKRSMWDSAEELFHNQLNSKNSQEAESKIFDPKLSTLTIERAYRVMAQLATGKVKGISTNDMGDARLKNLLLEKYVIPNANAQFDFLTKLRLFDIYSNVYGSAYGLVDQDVKQNGYVGPDLWMLNIRDVFPQVGAVSLDDSDYIIVRTWRPLSYFEKLKGQDGYKNLTEIINILKKKTGSKHDRPTEDKTRRAQDQYPDENPAKGKGYFEVLTRFERDRWVDLCVDANGIIFRDQKNPHDNGELPVVVKYSMPLFDDFMGMSDFERGGSMQKMVNDLWNLYGDAIKMSIYPPTIINKDNVASPSSIKPIPGAMWLGRGNSIDNIARPIQLNPQGISTFNNTYQVANAAILNLFGTTDTATSAQTDPGFGKTPAALEAQQARENTRDNADRFYMEQFVTQVMKKFVNLMCKQNKSVSFRMFPDEIDQIAREYPEIKESYNEQTGELTVNPGSKEVMYDYEIVPGSTYAKDQAKQQENLTMLLQLWMQSQTPQGNMLENQLMDGGYKLKFAELFKRIVANSGIQDWDKILEEMTTQEKGELTLQKDAAQFQTLMQQGVMGGMGGGVPPMPDQMQQEQAF